MKHLMANLHAIADENLGENWTFDASMAFLMERLGEDKLVYDYIFFSAVTGDSFTQLYREDYREYTDCLSEVMEPQKLIGMAFGACGYDYRLALADEIRKDPKPINRLICDYINRGVPVIAGRMDNGAYSTTVICGYEDDGSGYYLLHDAVAEPVKCAFVLEHCKWLAFAGEKYSSPQLSDIYLDAALNIQYWTMLPPKDGISFGKQAFRDWADSFMDGRFSDADLDFKDAMWKLHGTYLCMVGTNTGAARRFLRRAIERSPDTDCLETLEDIYRRQGQVFETLCGMEGGFGITPAAVRSRERMRPVADEIRKAAACCDEIMELMDNI